MHPSLGGDLLAGRCRLDTNATTFVADPLEPGANLRPGSAHRWPIVTDADGVGIDLRDVPAPGSHRSLLGWLTGFHGTAWATLTAADRDLGVRLAWDAEVLPHAWLWQELEGMDTFPWFRRARALAVEPASTVTSGPGRDQTLELGPHAETTAYVSLTVGHRDRVTAPLTTEGCAVIQIAEILSPRPEPWWALLRQAGVRDVVSFLRGAEQESRMFAALGLDRPAPDTDDEPWGLAALRHDKDLFAAEGFRLAAVEDTAPMDNVRLGLPGRDEEIDRIITQVRAMGELEIPVLCYNWMALSSWARTRIDIPSRGGALVTGFSLQESADLGDLISAGEVTEQQLWDALSYFLDAVLPEAEAAGVRLGLHPDDPPVSAVRAIPRIMSSLDAYRRLLDIAASRANAITFCQGNFALMTDDLPAAIHEFGRRDAIAFVHFRDVRGTAEGFEETFHDDGQTDMAACLRAYQEVGFDGPLRADHVPTMYGDSNSRPGYSVLGRLFAVGYIRGLQHAIYGHPAALAEHE